MSLPTIVAGGFAFLAVALCVAVAGRVLVDQLSAERRRTLSRLRSLGHPTPAATPDPPAGGGGWHRAVAWLGERVAAHTRNPLAGLRADLEYAGFTHPSAPLYYLGARLTLLVALAAGGGVLAGLTVRGPWQVTLWAAASGLFGYILPSLYLSNRMTGRQQAVRAGLPDALDVMVMCVESGTSVAAAVDCVTDEFQAVHPLLGEQLALIRHEMQLGQTAGQAFQAFGERCGVVEVRDLATILVQSEQYGTSVGKALRTHSEAARTERQLWCEGMAAKAAVKIMFPTLLCIFPAMFIVLLGPAAFQMTKMFSR